MMFDFENVFISQFKSSSSRPFVAICKKSDLVGSILAKVLQN